MNMNVKCQGTKEFGKSGMDGGIAWVVLDRHASDAQIHDRWPAYSAGIGREFTERCIIRRVNNRVLVTQHYGLDV